MDISLSGRIALVTGASRGIGKALALRLGKAGAIVFGTGTNIDSARSISRFLAENKLNGEGIVLDVNDSHEMQKVVDKIIAKKGRIDILINNAGVIKDGLAIRLNALDWSTVLNTNLSAVFSLSQAVLKVMLKSKYGRIVNISSLVAHTGNVGQVNYASAKAGLEAMSRVMAAEVASRNITVNCVAPGFIETDMTGKLGLERKNMICEQIPAKRMGEVEDVAYAVCFLASEQASYITGAVLHVNGGLYMG